MPSPQLNCIKLGLQDVLFDPKTKVIYTPNMNQSMVMSEGRVREFRRIDCTLYATETITNRETVQAAWDAIQMKLVGLDGYEVEYPVYPRLTPLHTCHVCVTTIPSNDDGYVGDRCRGRQSAGSGYEKVM